MKRVTNPSLRLLLLLSALLAVGGNSARADWSAEVLTLPAPVTAIRQAGDAVYIRVGSWLQVSICGGGRICVKPGAPPARVRARDRIPHGTVATAAGAGLVRAWYSEPTSRYAHGVLGDRTEAGALVAVDADCHRYETRLDADFVFEDLTPRLADMDGDGKPEIVTIRSRLDAGASIAIYGLRDGRLAEIAATAPIGTSNRWLNIAGIADVTGDGRLDIALVKTPHIDGRLEIWTLRSGSLERVAAAKGFSNHAIGSTELGLSAVADADGDGIPDLALPDQGRFVLRIVSVRGGVVHATAPIPVGGRISTAIGVAGSPGGPIFVMGLDDGRAVAVREN